MGKVDTFYREYEVFSKKTMDGPFQHQFSLLAPNQDMALIMAQENFMRREAVADIWIVERSAIKGLEPEEKRMLKRLDNKSYRTTKGYGHLRVKWRQYEQKQLDEKEIMSWGEDKTQ
ncbi:1,2-phenylacetyl-CoA epoxidase subunit PaaB [Bacillus testis]|uniref:1,2-phenylacetyl-CoA epoxidase subunit PaaB n=1 Tax=Bacillus testis TaxID=1622072 RepID=UPI00067F1533|nr:1,2-phenylacetyl-CoA epoxidase subunit PaaB [Bacillus testis]